MASKLKYFLFHKPYKILSQFSDEGENKGMGSILDLPKDVYPVGRLDLDSEGLLILTNDKRLNHRLLNPSYAHDRTYWVQVDGDVSQSAISHLRNGVDIKLKSGIYQTQPADVSRISKQEMGLEERSVPVNEIKYPVTSWLEIILKEGKNRQVRKMTAKVGYPTLRLVRIAIENLSLGSLKPGEVTMISQKAIYKKLRVER